MNIQAQVIMELKKKPSIKLGELKLIYPDTKASTLKTAYYRGKKSFSSKKLSETKETFHEVMNSELSRITMDGLEKLIVAGKTPIPLLRVMADFLKIKSMDHSELEEIDLTIFYKKAMEE